MTTTEHTSTVDGIPLLEVTGAPGGAPRRVALWLPFLGGTTATCLPVLVRLAAAGFHAVSLDPWQQGVRTTEAPEDVRDRALGAFRREMWPILGQTTLDAVHVLDRLTDRPDVAADGIVAGGFSLGGDVAVALAGVDHRVVRVATLGSTPDWRRPGMRALDGFGALVEQGEPATQGAWWCAQLDPVTHLHQYDHGPSLLFEAGGADDHVPVENARRFARELAAVGSPAVVQVHVTEGLGHPEAVRNPDAVDRCVAWLTHPDRQEIRA